MAKLGLSSPWVQYYHQAEAFFKQDKEVKVVYDNIEYHLYTFNTMTSMDDYDYDGMITDRIFYLRDRGIKTN